MNDGTTTPEADDVEGHRHSAPEPGAVDTDGDDVEGHRHSLGAQPGADEDEDDVEGHRHSAPVPGLKSGALDSDEDTPGFRTS